MDVVENLEHGSDISYNDKSNDDGLQTIIQSYITKIYKQIANKRYIQTTKHTDRNTHIHTYMHTYIHAYLQAYIHTKHISKQLIKQCIQTTKHTYAHI